VTHHSGSQPSYPRGGDPTGGSRPARERDSIQTLVRAASLLRELEGAGPQGLTSIELATRIDVPRSTAHRIVAALLEEGLLTRSSVRGGVRLGPRLASFGLAAFHELRRRLHPHMQRLAHQLGETVELAVLSGAQVAIIDRVLSPQRLHAGSPVGFTFPAHSCAAGKTLLAAMPAGDVEDLLPPTLPRLTRRTITSQAALLDELEAVRDGGGIAWDREEHTEGVCATAIMTHETGGVAAVAVVVPAQRFYNADTEAQHAVALRELIRAVDARPPMAPTVPVVADDATLVPEDQ